MTPTKQEMLEKIYEVIADKTLSFGCVLHDPAGQKAIIKVHGRLGFDVMYISGCDGNVDMNWLAEGKIHKDCGYEIIGHPVMIGDLLDWRGKLKSKDAVKELGIILNLWTEKRKPIDEQTDECISFIYNLLSHGNQD